MSNGNNSNGLNPSHHRPAAVAMAAQHFEGLEPRTLMSGAPTDTDSAMAYDASGNLHVAYYDASAHNLKYMVQSASNGSWSAPVTVDSSSNDVGQQVSIAVDKSGLPGIAYRDAAKQDLKYAHFDGAKWTVSTVDSKNNTGVNPSLAYDKQNHALVTYYRPSAKALELATQNGKKWTFATIATKSSAGTTSSIAINPSTGQLAIAYTGADGKVRYAEKTGGKLSKPVVVDAIGKAGSDVSLTFGPDKKPAFSYTDPTTGEVKLAVKSGKSSFDVQTVATVDPGQDAGARTLIDPATGLPQVVFYDSANNGVFVASQGGDVSLVGPGGNAGTPVVVDPKTGKLLFTDTSDTDGTPNIHDTRVIPAPPTDVDATTVSATQIDVTWSDNSDNEAGFLVERSSDGSANFAVVAALDADVTSFSDTTVLEGGTYTYRVTAFGPTGVETLGLPLATATTLPAAPSDATTTAAGTSQIDLAWSAHSSGVTGYVVERSSDNGATFTQLAHLPATATTYQDTTATEGAAYTYRVVAVNAAGRSLPAAATGNALVAAPTDLTGAAASAGRVDLAWTNHSAHATGYVVERSADGGDHFTTLGTLAAGTSAFADTTVTAGASYVYRVRATGAGGASAYATSTTVVVNPAAPSITATTVSTTQVDLAWPAVNGATGYVVERSDDGGDTFNPIATVTTPGYSDASALESSAYVYRVRATNAAGHSNNSNTPAVTTFLAAPSNVIVYAASATQMHVIWTDNSQTETGFEIERSDDGGDTFAPVGTVGPNTTMFQDDAVVEGVHYLYRVHAIKASHVSDYTPTTAATTFMVAPDGLTATASSPTQVDLAWNDNSSAETGYEIYRSTNGGDYALIHTTAPGATSYSDAVTEGSSYTYKVRAVNDITASADSDPQSVTTLPAAPSGLVGTVVSSTQINLSWSDNSNGETGYRIERSVNGGSFSTLVTLDPGSATYNDASCTEGTTYAYRVIATNDAGDSAASGTVTAVTRAATPTSLTASATDANTVHLAWADNSNNESGYIVERSDDGGDTFTAVSSLLPADTATFDDTTAAGGTSYVYRVSAVNAASVNSPSDTQSVLTQPDAVTGVTANPTGTTTLTVTWIAVTGADSYTVERSDDGGATWNPVGTPVATNTLNDSTATEGGTFTYRITATNATGDGATSTASTPVTTVPAAPDTLVATPVSATQVDLTWADHSAHESGYRVERSVNGGAFATLTTLAADAVSYSDTSATAATSYTYRVIAEGVGGDSAASNTSDVLTVPAAPSSASAIASADTHATLSWTPVTGATGYVVDRSSDGGTSFPDSFTVGNVLTYNDLTAAEATAYVYRVRATNATGSGDAAVAGAITTLPAAATNLTATPVTPTRVDLAWTDNSNGESGYLVERSSNGGANYTPLIVLSPNATTYSDTAAAEGTAYVYRIKPVDAAGTGAGIAANATTVPAAPASLVATPVSATQVDLTWADNSAKETGYVIQRSDDGGAWADVHTTAASATSWSDTTVAGGHSYEYRVHATGAGGSSADSNTQTVLTVPGAVTDLTPTVASDTEITLAWTDASGETGYSLERSINGGAFSPLTTLPADSTSYDDTGLTEGTTYAYRLTASNTTGDSALSNAPSATTLPAAPDTLAATPVSATEVDLTWNTNSAHEDGFVIERSTNGGSYVAIHSTNPGETSYNDTDVTGGNTYAYRVHAAQGSAVSADSNTDTVLTVPDAPTHVVATVDSDTSVTLTWDAMTGADSYLVEVSPDGLTGWTTVGTPTTNSLTDTSATEASNYTYRVTAINVTGSSATTLSNAVLTLPAAVTNVLATPVNAGKVTLTWDDNSSNESGYRVERSTDGNDFSFTQNLPAGTTTWDDTTVSAGTTYYYRVYAVDTTGDSADSNVSTVLTHPAQVANLTATPTAPTQVDLSWEAVTSATGYLIERSSDGGSTFPDTFNVGAVTTFSDTTAASSSAYVYRVTAINATGSGAASATQAAATVPLAPTGFTVTPVSAGQIDLSWNDVAGENYYWIERSDNGGTWTAVQMGSPDVTTWSDTSVTGGNTYTYRITAHRNSAGDSATVTASDVLTVPDAVANFHATSLSTTAIDLSWDATHGATGYQIEYSADGNAPWTTLTTINDPATTLFHDTGLTEGSARSYRISAIDGTGSSATTTDATATYAAPATGLTATNVAANEVDLTWSDNSTGESGYKVQRRAVGDTTWTTLFTTAADATGYNDTTASYGTDYEYQVLATDAGGDSDPSNTSAVLVIPDQVTGLTPTPVSASEVDLSWSAVTGAGDYAVYRLNVDGITWDQIGTPTGTTFQDTGLTEATTYTYHVIARNTGGAGAASADQTGLTLPAAPDTLVATGSGTTTINLTWADHSAGEDGYRVERSDDGGQHWTQIGTAAADATTYSDTDVALTEGTTHLYQVRAYDASGNSTYSDPATGNTAPAAPDTLVATPVSATHVTVTWADHSNGESGFEIQRSTDAGAHWTTIGTTDPDVTTYEDTTAPEGTALQYQVRAVKGTVNSTYTSAANATTVPAAASDLTATASSPTQVDLTWTDNSANETGYDIYRSTDNGDNWTLIHSAADSTQSWSDTAAPEDTALQYKVVATGAGGDSADSNVASATTPIAAPTTLVATPTSDSTIDLSWADNSSAETGYKIQRFDGTTWTTIHTTAADVTTWTDTGLTEDTAYTYRVLATDGTVDSDPSNAPSATTALTAPVVTAISSPAPDQVTLTWSDNSSAETGYQIERFDGVTWNLVHTTAADETTWTDTGLTEGTQYQYRVRAANAGNLSAYTSTSTVTTLPAAPATVTATPFSTTQIDIAWTDSSANEDGYVVERSDDGSTWQDVQTLPADSTSWSDTTGLTEGHDYQYRVRATSAAGNSPESTVSSTSTKPNAPSSLTVTMISDTAVQLNWADNSAGETGYEVQRSTDGGSTFTHLADITDPDVTSFTDTTATEATAYVYQIRAVRNGVNSDWSNATTQVTTLPAAPTTLAVSSVTSNRVTLTWADNSAGETGYKVQRSSDGGQNWVTINTTLPNVTTYSDNTVTEGGSYAYQVLAFNTTGDSLPSDAVTAAIVPASPTGLSASAANPNRVDLSWTDRSSHENGYYVERSTNGGASWSVIKTLPADSTSYSDSTVTEAVSYQYRVRAFGDGGNSGYTASVAATTPLNAPTGLTTTTVSATRVNLTWTDNSNAETAYKVERADDGQSNWTVIATTLANATTYADTTAAEGHTYQYRVRASKNSNTSVYSGTSTATTLPAAPTSLTATVASDTQVNLAWADNSAGETGFVVERFDGTTWTQIATPAANATSYSDTTATEGTAYTYRVKAVNAGGPSAYATSTPVTTLPAAPTALDATSPDANTVTLTWTDNSAHETGFRVERYDGVSWTEIGTVGAGVTTYTDTAVDEGQTYQYRVRASIDATNSAYSNTKSVTTVPNAPTMLNATVASATEVDLAWDDNSAGETSYKIERSDDGGLTFTEIASVAADTTTYQDTTALEGTYYQYRVRAANTGGNSGYSPSAEALTLPADPSDLVATAVAPDEIDLTWTDNSVGEDGFILERETDGSGTWDTLSSSLAPDSNSYVDSTVSSGHTYAYRLVAYNSTGNSGTTTASTTTP